MQVLVKGKKKKSILHRIGHPQNPFWNLERLGIDMSRHDIIPLSPSRAGPGNQIDNIQHRTVDNPHGMSGMPTRAPIVDDIRVARDRPRGSPTGNQRRIGRHAAEPYPELAITQGTVGEVHGFVEAAHRERG